MIEKRTGTEGRTPAVRTLSRVAAALLVAVLAVSLAGCNRFKARQLIRQGNTYFKEQLYEDALKKYQEAKELDPNEVKLDKFLAMGYMALYNPGSTHPKDQEALEKAIEHFKKYLAVKPDDEKASKFLMTTYMNAQKYDDAIEYFKDFIQKHPADSAAVQTVAMLYARKGDFENSMVWQRKRAELEPTNAEVFYTMGVTAWDKSYNSVPDAMAGEVRRGIVDEGMKNLDKALELKPDYFEAMFYVNLLYREMAKLENDPAKKAELAAKADEWQKKGLEVRKQAQEKARQEQAKTNPLEGM
jgi:tetratricopeptide (TPR) repeat protein